MAYNLFPIPTTSAAATIRFDYGALGGREKPYAGGMAALKARVENGRLTTTSMMPNAQRCTALGCRPRSRGMTLQLASAVLVVVASLTACSSPQTAGSAEATRQLPASTGGSRESSDLGEARHPARARDTKTVPSWKVVPKDPERSATRPPCTPAGSGSGAPARSATLGAASAAFAAGLYCQLREAPENIVVSPANLHSVLSMAYAGARKRTADEMRQALSLVELDETVHTSWAEQLRRWERIRGAQIIAVGARAFVDRRLEVKTEFAHMLRTQYQSPFEPTNFFQSEAARQRINQWIFERTRRHIAELLPPGSIDSQTALVLTSAAYFKGKWLRRFKTRDTRPGEFRLNATERVQVPLMHQEERFGFATVDGVKVLEMPYVGRHFSMVLVMSDREGQDPLDDLQRLEDRLDGERIGAWFSALKETKLPVAVPRFSIKPSSTLKLRPMLEAMGMRIAFTDGADFSGIADARLLIDNAYHRATIDVDEEGTIAAAASAVVIKYRSGGGPSFVANRPFLYLIRDLQTGVILFMGRVVDPSRPA